MKIEFEKVYFDEEAKYILFRSNPEKYYLLRIMDFENGARFGNSIADPSEIKAGGCVVGEYLITKDEFDLWDTKEEEFHALLEALATVSPSDRLLKLTFQQTPKSQPTAIKANVGEPTGTEPNLVQQMQEELKAEGKAGIERFEKFLAGGEGDVYFIHSSHLNKIFPAIDFEGKIFFVETEAEAKKLVEATKMFGNRYYKVSSEQANEIIRNCKKYGVFKIVFCMADGGACGFDRDAILGEPAEDKWQTYNSSIYNIFIRCIECAGIDNEQVRANLMTLTSQLSHQIFSTTFLLPLAVKAEEKPNTIVLSKGAEKLYNENKFMHYKADGLTYKPMEGNQFTAVTLTNTKDKSHALPLFTDFEEFSRMFGEKSVPVAVTIEEAYSMLNDSCKTILFNPQTLGFMFAEDAMNQLRELSKKPVTVYRPKQEEEKQTTVTIPDVPQEISTENILNLVANQITRDDAVKKENIAAHEKKQAVESDVEAEEIEEIEESVNTEEETTKEETAEAVNEQAEAKANVDEPQNESKPLTEDTVEAQTDKKAEETHEKKGGFFSRFKKKK